MTYEENTADYERQIREYHEVAFMGGFSGIPEAVRMRTERDALAAEVESLKRSNGHGGSGDPVRAEREPSSG